MTEISTFYVNYPHWYQGISEEMYWKAVGVIEEAFGLDYGVVSFEDNTLAYYTFDSATCEVISVVCVSIKRSNDVASVELYNVSTATKYRRQGYMRRLIQYIIDQYISPNVYVLIDVDCDNNSAYDLYSSLGFIVVCEEGNRKRMRLRS